MTAYVFPGQGAQFPGMEKPCMNPNPWQRNSLKRQTCCLVLPSPISCSGYEEDSANPRYATCHLSAFGYPGKVHGNRFHPDMVAGHSLGEFFCSGGQRCPFFRRWPFTGCKACSGHCKSLRASAFHHGSSSGTG